VAFDIDAGAEVGIVRSTDGGTNWSSNLAATFVEATIDQCTLFPATGTGDNNDIWAIYQDASADALTMKMWDSSAAAEVESSTMQTMVENTTDGLGQMGFSGSVRHSDGAIVVVSCSERDTATADMQCWVVTAVNAGSLTGITAKTNITTNIDDNYNPQVFINQGNNDIFVAYNGKRDGSEDMAGGGTKIYYTKSTDGGTSWSAGDTTYKEGAVALTTCDWAPLMGPRFYVSWRSTTTLNGNAVNSLAFYSITAAQASFSLTGQSANLLFAQRLSAEQASFSLTGQDATLTIGTAAITLTAAHGSFSLSGQSANLLWKRPLTAVQASFTLTGQSANLLWKRLISAVQASYALTGNSANLLWKRFLSAVQASYTLSGNAANLLWKRVLSAVQTAFSLTGQDVTLTYTPAGAISAETGSFALSGQTANLLWKQQLATVHGSFSFSGQDAVFLRTRAISAAQASFVLTGYDATLSYVVGAVTITAEHGSFILTGFGPSFRTIYANDPFYISQFGGTLMSITQGSMTELDLVAKR
jgi:hypothetical protein